MRKTETDLRNSLKEMIAVYWGDGDGIQPPPACIVRAQTAVSASEDENQDSEVTFR